VKYFIPCPLLLVELSYGGPSPGADDCQFTDRLKDNDTVSYGRLVR